jgi:asparagine synthase (glutamine-hydrolysing)
LSRYWSYRDVLREGLEDPLSDENEALDELEAVLGRAVWNQSIADVPVGAFLSGGIDSSSVVALYQKYSTQPVRTFTIGFEEAAFNEAPYARAVAKHFGSEHHERIVTAREAQEVIPQLPRIYDEPFADSSQIPTFLVSRFAREQVTVSLSGDGGDELFGGYDRYFAPALFWSKLNHVPRSLRAAAGALLGRIPAGVWSGLGHVLPSGGLPPGYSGEKMRTWVQIATKAGSFEDVAAPLFDEWRGQAPILNAQEFAPTCGLDFDLADAAPDQLRMMYCDALSYLPDDILCKVDRASMAVSLESRVPFLDHRVAALAARIPLDMKIRGETGKHVLRKLLYRHAPRQLFERPKSGFAIPVGDWIKGPLRDWAESLLDQRLMRAEGWFDAGLVAQRWQDHLAGRRDSTSALWAVLMFEAWLQNEDTVRLAA